MSPKEKRDYLKTEQNKKDEHINILSHEPQIPGPRAAKGTRRGGRRRPVMWQAGGGAGCRNHRHSDFLTTERNPRGRDVLGRRAMQLLLRAEGRGSRTPHSRSPGALTPMTEVASYLHAAFDHPPADLKSPLSRSAPWIQCK